ncbi:Hypothetical predicted protein [Octopus vulgaris]|uniref:Transient receptor potential cation channel subfamily M member 2 n=1 Tax=Octopus vulgaris TaxID=6645 RepID=A0AA36FE15_OCTVU|nr:Hypothetical predicted protein [Octopus vulgaris]
MDRDIGRSGVGNIRSSFHLQQTLASNWIRHSQEEDEMDSSDEKSDLEVDEYFEQLKRKDDKDSLEEDRSADDSWLANNIVKYSRKEERLERLEMAEVSGQKPKQTSDKKWIEKNIKLRQNQPYVKIKLPPTPSQYLDTIINQFVRVDHQTPMEIMMYLIRSAWNIRLPSLLISVIGGREDIQLNPHDEAVGRGLYKAARTIDAWIITEGLHTGVAKYIGEVMHNKENKVVAMNEVTTLGIAPWNCVLDKKSLVNKQGSWPVWYYTRTNSKKKKTEVKIPAVAVMVGGGPGTLKSVHDSISRNIPVVIVKDSGRAADIMADAYQRKLENSNEEDEDINDRKLKTDIRVKIFKEFKMELKENGIDNLVDYVLMSLKRPDLLTVYDIDSEKEFDLTMFKAVFKAKNNIENMRLGLAWNKPDVLKRLISEGDIPWEDVKKWIQENIKLRNLRDEEASNPCDAFGEVKFVEHDQKIAKFVRVDHQTPMDIIINLIIYQWNFSLPNLLISVIGGREDVQLNEPTKEALGHSLVKAARTTDAWIISEGLHSGVVKYIGEAISDNENKVADMKKVKTIGIARWNCVQNKESLVNKEGLWPANYSNGGEYALDPNHTHFILVDDGTNDTSGVELEFKKQLEDTILQIKRQKTTIPAVAVMVGEELETLKSAYDSLSRNIPVIIVKGSGKAADIMADVYEALLKKDEEGKDITERSILEQLKADIKKQQGANDLVDCVFDSMKHLDLITVCNIQSPEDFDVAIMKAVFKGYKEMDAGKHKIEFIRVDHQISMETTINLIKRLWYTSLPNLLISVIGERQYFLLDPFTTEALGRGLVKAAQITGAWIISDGLHTGVAKHIGKAIHDNEAAMTGKKKVVTIGIASWNCVQNKESLVNEEGSWPANYEIKDGIDSTTSALDPNHSHFILVDDGTQETLGVEAEFRKKLEDTISQYEIPGTRFKVPAVVIFVGDKMETLKSVSDSISRNIPVVIVKVSKQTIL